MIIEYTDGNVHRIRLDFSDLKEVPVLCSPKDIASCHDVMANESKLLRAAELVTSEVRSVTKIYSVLTYQDGKMWLNGYDK